MQKIRKIVAGLLVSCLCVSMVPAHVLAYEEESTEQVVETEIEQTEDVTMTEDDDPGEGRLEGYVPEGFYDEGQTSRVVPGVSNIIHNEKFSGCTLEQGIDVSSHNAEIDWAKVKAAGIDFAIIRVGYRGYGTTGSLNYDTYAIKNIKGAIEAGIPVGVYIFSQAITTQEAIAEADFVISKIRAYNITLPVVFDYEYASTSSGLTGRLYKANLSVKAATNICTAFCERVASYGYTPMVYANKSFLESVIDGAALGEKYQIWLANYTTETKYEGKYDYWQYTETGTVDGITGKVDMNFRYLQDDIGCRIYGQTRYETSYAIADALKEQLDVEQFDTMLIASGTNFADALAGSYLAYKENAPILMADKKHAESLRTYISENLKQGGTLYVLGRTAAVPDEIINGLTGCTIERIGGENRYETNLKILQKAGVTKEDILVCTGNGFADSLSASAAKKPILLVKNTLNDAQKEYIQTLSSENFYIIGGESAVSKAAEEEITAYGKVERIGGENRYETSVLVAKAFVENPESAVLAYALNYPDGLCGGPLAMSMNAPLILTTDSRKDAAISYTTENGISQGKVLGGASLISNKTAMEILNLESVD